MPAAPSPAPIHRRAVDLGAPARRQLMEAMRESSSQMLPAGRTSRTTWPACRSHGRPRAVSSRSLSACACSANTPPPTTPGSAHPRREQAAPELRYLPAPGPRLERPPRDIVDIVEQATGVRLGDTVIDRSPEITDRAVRHGRDRIHRGRHGPPSGRARRHQRVENKAIVAHELTHVAQQQTRRHVPSEDSPEGRELEAEAREMQRRFGGVVRPHFMRRRPGSVDVAAGVQRLAGDDDSYAWQQRGRVAVAGQCARRVQLHVAAGSERERRQQHEDEEWARQFETDHAQHLNQLRHAATTSSRRRRSGRSGTLPCARTCRRQPHSTGTRRSSCAASSTTRCRGSSVSRAHPGPVPGTSPARAATPGRR